MASEIKYSETERKMLESLQISSDLEQECARLPSHMARQGLLVVRARARVRHLEDQLKEMFSILYDDAVDSLGPGSKEQERKSYVYRAQQYKGIQQSLRIAKRTLDTHEVLRDSLKAKGFEIRNIIELRQEEWGSQFASQPRKKKRISDEDLYDSVEEVHAMLKEE